MDKNKKIVLTILSLIAIGLLVYLVSWLISAISLYKHLSSLSIEYADYHKPIITRHILGIISVVLACLVIVCFNLALWFKKQLFGIPLTAEQLAERKAIKAERKKAKLQEKLNKFN